MGKLSNYRIIYIFLYVALSKMLFCSGWLCDSAHGTRLLNLRHSPSPYECAILSKHAYQNNLQVGSPVKWKEIDARAEINGWRVAHVLTENTNEAPLSKAFERLGLPYGYKGVIYAHDERKQYVLAHRGTDIKNMSAVKTDLFSIAQNIIGGQERSIPHILGGAIPYAQKENHSLTVTGHSLGGWLAQITVFVARDLYRDLYPKVHLKAITFDTPGARPMLEQINPRNNPIDLIDQLDITNYLSSPNLINACNEHIGSLYRIVFEALTGDGLLSIYTLQTHELSKLINAFDPTTGDASKCIQVNSWPVVSAAALKKSSQALLKDNKLNSVWVLCELFQKCIQKKHLGEYSEFFRLAKKVNQYHPEETDLLSQERFDLRYKYHYNTKLCNFNQLHIRHFPDNVRSFLNGLARKEEFHVKIAEQAQWLQTIEWDQQKKHVIIPNILPETDLRIYCDRLVSIVLDKQPQLQTINLKITNLLPSPPFIDFFVGREKEQKLLQKPLNQVGQYRVIAPPITGPGGIGKTQLVLRVLDRLYKKYEHVFWIPAKSEEELLAAYQRIADGLGIFLDEKDSRKVVNTVRDYLKTKHCLYVFDDAPNRKVIEDYLPLVQGQGHVLITSRNSGVSIWGEKSLLMKPLDEREALDLAQKFGRWENEEEQQALQSLLKHVGYYPLALVHLFSIMEHEGHNPVTFLKDLEQHATKKQELITMLDERPHDRIRYDKSIVYVFKTSLERLSQEEQGREALEIIKQLSYLDPRGIPLDWILTWNSEDVTPLKRKSRQALALLATHSFIQWGRDLRDYQQVYIHAETQLMVRCLHPQLSLKILIDSLVDYAGDEKVAFQQAAKWIALLPHGRMLFERLDTDNTDGYLDAAYKLTRCLATAAKVACLFQEGVKWGRQELNIAEQLYPNQDHLSKARSCSELGTTLSHLGEYEQALDYKQQALEMRRRLLEDQDDPDLAHSLNSVGELFSHLGKHQEALDYSKRALEMRKAIYQGNHPDVARSLNSVGISHEDLGNLSEALEYKQQALEMRKLLADKQDHPDTAHSLNNVGETLIKLGEVDVGIEHCQEGLDMRKRLFNGQDHPYVAQSLNGLGLGYAALGSYEKAASNYQQAVEMAVRVFRGSHPKLTSYLNNLTETFSRLETEKVQQIKENIRQCCIEVLSKDISIEELTAASKCS